MGLASESKISPGLLMMLRVLNTTCAGSSKCMWKDFDDRRKNLSTIPVEEMRGKTYTQIILWFIVCFLTV